jgi:hypothetical protein
MRTRSDELRLVDVQAKIEMLYRRRDDDFNLPERYRALVDLEAILLERVQATNSRRERELAVLG